MNTIWKYLAFRHEITEHRCLLKEGNLMDFIIWKILSWINPGDKIQYHEEQEIDLDWEEQKEKGFE